MSSYRIDIRPLLDEVGASMSISDTLDVEELVVGEITFTMLAPPAFHVSVSNAGEAIVMIGSIVARVSTPCVRCLREFESVIEGEADAMWARAGSAAADEDEDAPPAVDADGSVDLEPALMAALVIEAPFAPVHDEACKGLCSACGADLNSERCTCATESEESHPFAGLRTLLPDVAEGSDEEPA